MCCHSFAVSRLDGHQRLCIAEHATYPALSVSLTTTYRPLPRAGLRSVIAASLRVSPVSVMLALLGLAMAAGLAQTLYTIAIPYPFSNEGWTAYHALNAATGQPLYPSAGSTIYNNYPPLGFYLIGGLGQSLGDTILAGRLLSIIAYLGIAAAVYAALRTMGTGRRAALFGLGVFACTFLYDYDYTGVSDPQIIANATAMAGLVMLLSAPRGIARLALAALLFAIAFFIKHSVIALPLVAGLWLLAVDRRAGLKFLGFGLLFGAAGLGLFRLAYGQNLLTLLHDPRVYWINFALWAMGGRLPAAVLPLAAMAVTAWRWRRDPHLLFCVCYLALSCALAFYFLGGAGTGGKMLFDAVIALALCAGIGLQRWHETNPKAMAWFALCQFLPVVMIIGFKAASGKLPHHWLSPASLPVTDSARDIAFLKAQKGPVLCGEPALCFRAGKPFGIDLWGYQEAVAVKVRDGHELLTMIRKRKYAALELSRPPNALGAPPEGDPVWSATVSAAIQENYRIAYTNTNGAMWVAK